MTRAFLASLAAGPALPQEALLAYQRIREAEEGVARTAARKWAKVRRKSPALRLRR